MVIFKTEKHAATNPLTPTIYSHEAPFKELTTLKQSLLMCIEFHVCFFYYEMLSVMMLFQLSLKCFISLN